MPDCGRFANSSSCADQLIALLDTAAEDELACPESAFLSALCSREQRRQQQHLQAAKRARKDRIQPGPTAERFGFHPPLGDERSSEVESRSSNSSSSYLVWYTAQCSYAQRASKAAAPSGTASPGQVNAASAGLLDRLAALNAIGDRAQMRAVLATDQLQQQQQQQQQQQSIGLRNSSSSVVPEPLATYERFNELTYGFAPKSRRAAPQPTIQTDTSSSSATTTMSSAGIVRQSIPIIGTGLRAVDRRQQQQQQQQPQKLELDRRQKSAQSRVASARSNADIFAEERHHRPSSVQVAEATALPGVGAESGIRWGASSAPMQQNLPPLA